MHAAIRAGALYFAIVFAIGFALGTVRVLAFIPVVGERTAVLIELPIMLTASWLACCAIVQRLRLPASVATRAAMGAIAFLLLMVAELALSVLGFGRSVGEHIALYRNPTNLLGLAAQILFALFPLIDGLRDRAPSQPSGD